MIHDTTPPIQQTIKVYNSIARKYSICWSNDTCMHDRLRKFLSYLPENPLVADVGCGDGRDMKFLNDHGSCIIGIDLSMEMLKMSKAIFPGGNIALMDMRNLGFFSKAFHGIWATASVLHIPRNQIGHVLKEFYRILKKDGILFLSMKMGEGDTFVDDGRFFVYYQQSELVQIIKRYHFSILDYEYNESHKSTYNKPITKKWMSFWCKKQ